MEKKIDIKFNKFCEKYLLKSKKIKLIKFFEKYSIKYFSPKNWKPKIKTFLTKISVIFL